MCAYTYIYMQLGTHVLIDARVIDGIWLNDADKLNTLLKDITKVCELTCVNTCEHKFTPQGYTICHVLAESHVSIHTWPEFNAFALDVYSCKHDLDEEKIKACLGPLKQCTVQKVKRGYD